MKIINFKKNKPVFKLKLISVRRSIFFFSFEISGSFDDKRVFFRFRSGTRDVVSFISGTGTGTRENRLTLNIYEPVTIFSKNLSKTITLIIKGSISDGETNIYMIISYLSY